MQILVLVAVATAALAAGAAELQSVPELSMDLQTEDLQAVMSRWTLGGDAEVSDDKVYLTRNVQVCRFLVLQTTFVVIQRFVT